MKNLTFVTLLLASLFFASCEKPSLEGDEKKPKKPHTEKPDDKGKEDEKPPENPKDYITIHDFLTKDYSSQIWVAGYIVGACKRSISNAELKAPFSFQTALLLADDKNETDKGKMMTLELRTKSVARRELNLVDHPENHRKRIKVYGYQTTYMGVRGMKKWGSLYEWMK